MDFRNILQQTFLQELGLAFRFERSALHVPLGDEAEEWEAILTGSFHKASNETVVDLLSDAGACDLQDQDAGEMRSWGHPRHDIFRLQYPQRISGDPHRLAI